MDELVRQIVTRTGVSEAQARQAVDIVLNFAQSRLPAPIASQLGSIIGSDSAADSNTAGDVQDQMKKLGGLFGNRE